MPDVDMLIYVIFNDFLVLEHAPSYNYIISHNYSSVYTGVHHVQ